MNSWIIFAAMMLACNFLLKRRSGALALSWALAILQMTLLSVIHSDFASYSGTAFFTFWMLLSVLMATSIWFAYGLLLKTFKKPTGRTIDL